MNTFNRIKNELEGKILSYAEFENEYLDLCDLDFENNGYSGVYPNCTLWTASDQDTLESFIFYTKG